MSNKKVFGKLIAFESIYMLIVIAIACACSLLQIVNKRFDSTYSSFIFSGTNYKYNYLFYFLGFVLFITISFVTYKLVFAKYFDLISQINIGFKIISWVVLVIFSALMVLCITFVLFVTVLGLSANLLPDSLFIITVVGWPVIILVFLTVEIIRRSSTKVS